MSADSWAHQFCLACDRQVDSDAAYCSEACRLTEFESLWDRRSSTSSQASSPGLTPPSYPWQGMTKPIDQVPCSMKYYLSPAYDFTNSSPYGPHPVQQKLFGNYTMSSNKGYQQPTQPGRALSPSSSHTSLCSMQSSSTTSDPNHISDKARAELRAYAGSFESAQRRRSA